MNIQTKLECVSEADLSSLVGCSLGKAGGPYYSEACTITLCGKALALFSNIRQGR